MIRDCLRSVYVRFLRPHLKSELAQQRMKMLLDVWGYWRLLLLTGLPLRQRVRLIRAFLTIDWRVPHSHSASEITAVCQAISERPARADEVVLEAGCWQGGSSAKLSLICELLGYRLCIYDSFAGVEQLTPEEKALSYDFSGQYASPEHVLWQNLEHYGQPHICSVHRGWFADTLASSPVVHPVRVAFIDCDIAKGTKEVLAGVLPALTADGRIFSQDFHLLPVQRLLQDPAMWDQLGVEFPEVRRLGRRLASIRFSSQPSARKQQLVS